MTDKNRKRVIFLLILAAATAAVCFAAFYIGGKAAIYHSAHKRLENDISEKSAQYEELLKEKAQLELDINEYKASAEADSEMNVKMKEHEDKTAQLNASIEQAKTEGEELDKQLNEKRGLEQHVDSTSASVSGQSRVLKEGTYSCPANIEEGSYVLSAADGNIVVYGTNGSIRVSQNLSRIDGNEFTVKIKSGERLKVDKAVTIKGDGKITAEPTPR